MEYWGVDCSSRSAGIAIPDAEAYSINLIFRDQDLWIAHPALRESRSLIWWLKIKACIALRYQFFCSDY